MSRRTCTRIGATILGISIVCAALGAQEIDPPHVDEAALAARLVAMTQPTAGERAIILYDPTYYSGIATRLREQLHRRGVFTYALVEESPAIIETYLEDDLRHERQEQDAIATLKPLFDRADIFYWMPARGYTDDLRWERVVEQTRVRSVHFHWLLPFPGARTAEQIATESRQLERRCLEVDFAAHARRQEGLAAALRGQTVRITTPDGTDLRMRVPADQWFHLGNGDASRQRAATARSIRDREIELPVGMFNFVPPADDVDGVLVAPAIPRAGDDVRDARLVLRDGRVVDLSARAGAGTIRRSFADIGPDGNRVATVWLNTNPHYEQPGVTIELGSNWENGGSNRATAAERLGIRLAEATIVAGNVTIMERGRFRWDAIR